MHSATELIAEREVERQVTTNLRSERDAAFRDSAELPVPQKEGAEQDQK